MMKVLDRIQIESEDGSSLNHPLVLLFSAAVVVTVSLVKERPNELELYGDVAFTVMLSMILNVILQRDEDLTVSGILPLVRMSGNYGTLVRAVPSALLYGEILICNTYGLVREMCI